MPFQACDFLYSISHRMHGRVTHEAALSCGLDLLVSQFHIPVQRGEGKLPGIELYSRENRKRLKCNTYLPAPLLAF